VVAGTADENWNAIDRALAVGIRGLPGGTTLAKLLLKHRGVRNHLPAPPLTGAIILAWADDHHRRTGRYLKHNDGPIPAAPPETWGGAENALIKGSRGLPGGDSLAKFLTRHRSVRNKADLPPLSVGQIKTWAKALKARTGNRPRAHSGQIPEAPGESWAAVHSALAGGLRVFRVATAWHG
jgi:hypothetical protein